MNQLSLFFEASDNSAISAVVADLPPLPKIIIYEDDYDEVVRTVEFPSSSDEFELVVSGVRYKINLINFDSSLRPLIRHFLLTNLLDFAPGTILLHYQGLRQFSSNSLKSLILGNPIEAKNKWSTYTNGIYLDAQISLKAFLRFLCNFELGAWASRFIKLVSALPVPYRDAYSVVRSGDCFLEIEEETALVRWIDQAATSIDTFCEEELRAASLVICAYQFGMRPKQLATLRKRDCQIRASKEDEKDSVYLTFRTLKQKDVQLSGLPQLRKVKREWAPLFVATYALLANEPASAFFFGFKSRLALSNCLVKKLDVILPGRGRGAYALRHSMAQRMVDAGASHEEIAAALGHTSLVTGLVYFRASATQAELVNKALGLSETYKKVAQIATDRFISEDELARLKGEQQIAGVPHGLPIAGIGGCKTGQPSCPYNPVTACYGCPKFMPVRNLALHEQVLKDFRSVVNDFRISGVGDQESPAYLQLRRTILEVQGVINRLRGHDGQ